MRRLVTDQARHYDQVLIDGAPMLVVADNHLLADLVDGIVLVFRATENTRGMAQRAVRQVLTLRAHLYGAVLNRVRATKGGYFRESYEAYYEYAESTPSAAPALAAASARFQSSPPEPGEGPSAADESDTT
jgi:Mrp family chromosome partitioning ATPase